MNFYDELNLDSIRKIDEEGHVFKSNNCSLNGIEYYYQALYWLNNLVPASDSKYVLVLLDCYANYIQGLEKQARVEIEETRGECVSYRYTWQLNVLRYRRLRVLCDQMLVDTSIRNTLRTILSAEFADQDCNIAQDMLFKESLILSFNDSLYCIRVPQRLTWDETKFDYNESPLTITNAENTLEHICESYIEYCTQAEGYASCYPELRYKETPEDALKFSDAEQCSKRMDNQIYKYIDTWYHKIDECAWEPKPNSSPWDIKEEL